MSKGGTAHFIGVSAGGALNVAGTVPSDVAVFSGGVETVLSGGVVTGASGSGTAISGGTVNVLSGGSFEHASIFSGGKLNVSKGGAVDDINVSSGGALNVAGKVTSNVVVWSRWRRDGVVGRRGQRLGRCRHSNLRRHSERAVGRRVFVC